MMTEKQKTTCGARKECYMKPEVKKLIEKAKHKDFHNITAREVARYIASTDAEGRDLPKPEAINDEAPQEPNVYSDGGLKKPKCEYWQVGGVGIWWPSRRDELEE